MKSLFITGARCALMVLGSATVANAQFGDYPPPPPVSLPHWQAPQNPQPPNNYAPPLQQQQIGQQQFAPLQPLAPQQFAPYQPAMTRDYAPPHQSVPHQSVPHQSVPHQAAPNLTAPLQQAPQVHTQYEPLQHTPSQAEPPIGLGVDGQLPVQQSFSSIGGYEALGPSCGVACAGPSWFGGVYGLYMTRDHGNEVWLSVDDLDISDHVMTSRDAAMDWGGGFETTIGKYFHGGQLAVAGTFWGLFPGDRESYAQAGVDTVGNLGTALTFDDVDYAGNPAASLYNNRDLHRLRREYEFHNVEVNMLGAACCFGGCGGVYGGLGHGPAIGGYAGMAGKGGKGGYGGCKSCNPCRLSLNWLAGIRYMHFGEGFQFASDAADLAFTGSPDEIYYDIDVDNHLIGFQIGGRADYCWNRLGLFGAVKVGAYGNYIDHHSSIGGSAGVATVNNINSIHNGQDWDVNSNKTDVAFIGELNMGLNYQLSCHWRATAGYRVVTLTGVAMAAEQIPTATFTDLAGIAGINSSNSLILHGGFAGLEFTY